MTTDHQQGINDEFQDLPLTDGQRAFWFMYNMDADSGAYNMFYAWYVRPGLDVPAFRKALEYLTSHHQVWRSTFVLNDDGVPIQRVHSMMEPNFEIIDASDKTEEELLAFLKKENYRPFDLENEPPLRWRLYEHPDCDPVVTLHLQHLCCDVWSVMIAVNQIRSLYADALAGKTLELPPVPHTNADFVKEQLEFIESEQGKTNLAFWKSHLEGELTPLAPPTYRSRPPVATYKNDAYRFHIPQDVVDKLKAFSLDVQISPFMIYLAVYQVMLNRFTGQNDLLVGVPTAGRADKYGDLFGYYVSPVVIRSKFSGNPSFMDYLKESAAISSDVLKHQDYPFPLLVQELNVPRDPSRSTMYQTVFFWENENRFVKENRKDPIVHLGDSGNEIWDMHGMEWERLPYLLQLDQFDVTLKISKLKDKLYGFMDYNTDLMDRSMIVRMSEAYLTLLESIADDSAQRLSDLPHFTVAERKQTLLSWNDTTTQYPEGLCIHQVFETQVAQSPDADAVGFGDERLSYREVNLKANRLAFQLRQKGIGPETFVALFVDPCLETMPAIFGILKAGATYVPLDPNYPKDRIEYILETADVPLLVTQKRLLSVLPDYKTDVVVVDEDVSLPPEADENPTNVNSPDNLVYVIFTSGSTGKPKGVQLPHRALVCTMDAMRREPGMKPRDILLSVTSLSFDLSVPDLYLPLTSGGCVVFVSREDAADGPELLEHLIKSKATWIQGTPSTYRLLIEAGWHAGMALKIICGGEPFPPELVGQLLDRCDSLWNMYGPTETCVWSTGYHLTSTDPPVSIGRPLSNEGVYLLDSNLQPVPVGVPGELCIGGDSIARGYLARTDLTCTVFVPNPFSGVPGDRIYRTGDLARYLPDGRLEHLGRIDHQVKIRGFRIELGEIESTLIDHDNVAQVVVMAREDTPGDQRLVGYVVPENRDTIKVVDLREHIKANLPEYMVPSAFVIMDALPLSPNGKVDRKKLPVPTVSRADMDDNYVMPANEAEVLIADIWQEVLSIDKVGTEDSFFELGGNSLLLVKVRARLQKVFNRKIMNTDLFQHTTITALAGFLAPGASETVPKKLVKERRKSSGETHELAIIGIAGRFPGARTVNQFWENLRDGVESIQFFSREELLAEGIEEELLDDEDYVRAGGYLDNYDCFDAAFFGISPREAISLDPQHRLFLETAYEVLEDSGYDSERYDGRIAVYAGSNISTYLLNNLITDRDYIADMGRLQVGIGHFPDILPTRVSHKLNLIGPGVSLETACSTSLVTIHHAAKSLLNDESDIALAGGVSVLVPQKIGYMWEEGGILSPDGHCRAFDADALGTNFGSGCGIVALKRLDEAIADRDNIRAIYKGSAINNDGSRKVGFTAPSIEGQAECIAEAQSYAGVKPDTITYIEAHGTATALGDPIEIAALTQAFRTGTNENGFCRIGSVKTNIGHLETAAGVTGVIKVILSMQNRMLPPSLHYKSSNPNIEFESTPFLVNSRLSDWNPAGFPRRAGISSFGIGGTNAHVILEEAPGLDVDNTSRDHKVLFLSAKTETALEQVSADMLAHLQVNSQANLSDMAYTLQVGRRALKYRRYVICNEIRDAIETLESKDSNKIVDKVQEPVRRRVVLMFSGQGAQYVNMARDLYHSEQGFRADIDTCAEYLKPHLEADLRDLLFPKGMDELTKEELKAASAIINQTNIAQPALFAIEYAMARLWMSWGLKPWTMIGHSIGEYPAACLAGVMSLESALALVAARGRLMQAQPSGDMMAVPMPADQVKPYLVEGVSIAAVNSPSRCVVAGAKAAIDTMEKKLDDDEIDCTRLHTSHAFHSEMMEPMLAPFIEEVKKAKLNKPSMPFISNVTGTWITDDNATDPEYWAKHLRGTVHFADGISELLKEDNIVFIEVGPGRALSTFAKGQLGADSGHDVVNSIRHPKHKENDNGFLSRAIGGLWQAGVDLDWKKYYGNENRRRVSMPTYPFEGVSYWKEPLKTEPLKQASTSVTAIAADSQEKPLVKKGDIADWFYIPSWKQTVSPGDLCDNPGPTRWLVFSDDCGLGPRLIQRLDEMGNPVIKVSRGEGFHKVKDGVYTLNPKERDDYDSLVQDLEESNNTPHVIIHLWSISRDNSAASTLDKALAAQHSGFYSLLYLAQALGDSGFENAMRIGIVSNNMQEVIGGELKHPEHATLIGPVKVIPLEYPHMHCRGIDIDLPEQGTRRETLLIEQLLNEMNAPTSDRLIAYRGSYRWVMDYQSARAEELPQKSVGLRQGGVYFITGGLGGIGLVLAEYLAANVQAKLVFTRRSAFPLREKWSQWLSSHDANDKTSIQIQKCRALEALGAEVLVVGADVSNEEQMRAAVHEAYRHFGTIHGVIHSAGIAGQRLIQMTNAEIAAGVLASKLQGSIIIQNLFREVSLDFLALCSSINTITGVFGQIDYCGGNAFLDAYSLYLSSQGKTKTLSVNWDAWDEVGMSVNTKVPAHMQAERDRVLAQAIKPAEGAEAFFRLIGRNVWPQVVVSTLDLPQKLKGGEIGDEPPPEIVITSSKPASAAAPPAVDVDLPKPPPEPKPVAVAPAAIGAYPAKEDKPPASNVEDKLAGLWTKSLGISSVSSGDNFFDLGGDSLLATSLARQIRKAFKIKLSPSIFNDLPTLSGLAGHIASMTGVPAVATPAVPSQQSSAAAPATPPAAAPQQALAASASVGKDDSLANLSELWKKALGVGSVSSTDNFFELGGDSLLATSLARQVRKAFKIKLSPALFNDVPTLAGMAAHIDGLLGKSPSDRPAPPPPAEASVPKETPAPTDAPAPPPVATKPNTVARKYAAPTNDVERDLAHMWEVLLDRAKIGIDENFFEIGGNPDLASNLMDRVNQHFKLDLPSSAIEEEPTIAGLAEQVETIRWATQSLLGSSADQDEEFEL